MPFNMYVALPVTVETDVPMSSRQAWFVCHSSAFEPHWSPCESHALTGRDCHAFLNARIAWHRHGHANEHAHGRHLRNTVWDTHSRRHAYRRGHACGGGNRHP